MSTFEIRVSLRGPIEALEAWRRQWLEDRLVSIVSDRGFKRESQCTIDYVDESTDDSFTLNVSVPHDFAKRSSKEVADALYEGLVTAVTQFTNMPCELSGAYARH